MKKENKVKKEENGKETMKRLQDEKVELETQLITQKTRNTELLHKIGKLREELDASERLANENAYLLAIEEERSRKHENTWKEVAQELERVREEKKGLIKQLLNARMRLASISLIVNSEIELDVQRVGVFDKE